MKKKAVIIIVVVVIVILIGVAIYLFVKGGKNGKKDTNKDTDTGGGDGIIPGLPPAIPPAPSPIPAVARCTKDAFPLGRGAKNQCVVALQTALGITADGNFGPMTEAAVKAKGYVVPLTNPDFDKILAGISAPVYGAAIKVGDKLKAIGYTPIFEDAGLTKPLKTKNSSGGTTGAWYFRKDDYVGVVKSIEGRDALKMKKYDNAPGCYDDCRTDFYVNKYYQYTKF
jgi:hypothetical protein